MTTNSITHQDGKFVVVSNGQTQTMKFADVNTFLRIQQVGTYDSQIQDQLGETQGVNEKRRELNLFMAEMRKLKSENKLFDKVKAKVDDIIKQIDDAYDNNVSSRDIQNRLNKIVNPIDLEFEVSGEFILNNKKSNARFSPTKHDDDDDRIAGNFLNERQVRFEVAKNVTTDFIEQEQITVGGRTDSLVDWVSHFGLQSPAIFFDGTETGKFDSFYDSILQNAKSTVDDLTTDSETHMLRFRQMVDKRGAALQDAKTTLGNDKRLKDAVANF